MTNLEKTLFLTVFKRDMDKFAIVGGYVIHDVGIFSLLDGNLGLKGMAVRGEEALSFCTDLKCKGLNYVYETAEYVAIECAMLVRRYWEENK